MNDTILSFYPEEIKKNLKVTDPFLTLEAILPEVLSKVDLIVFLSHLGYEMEKEIARRFKGIDIIINGHTSTTIDPPEKINQTILVGDGSMGRVVGFLKLSIEDKKIEDFSHKLIPLSCEIPGDSLIIQIVQPYLKKMEKQPSSETKADVIFFYDPECIHCYRLMEEFLPKMIAQYPDIEWKYLSIEEPENHKLLEEKWGDKDYEIPVIFVEDKFLSGEKEIKEKLDRLLKGFH